MVHLTLALVDFLFILAGGALWVGGGLVAAVLAGAGAGCTLVRMVRKRRRPR